MKLIAYIPYMKDFMLSIFEAETYLQTLLFNHFSWFFKNMFPFDCAYDNFCMFVAERICKHKQLDLMNNVAKIKKTVLEFQHQQGAF